VRDQEKLLEQEQRIQALETYRAQLQAGEACPLCGSHEHPAVAAYQALDVPATLRTLQAKREQLDSLAERGRQLAAELEKLAARLEQQEQQLQRSRQSQAEQELRWQALSGQLDSPLVDAAALAERQAQQASELQVLQSNLDQLEQLKTSAEQARQARVQLEQGYGEQEKRQALAIQQLQQREERGRELQGRQELLQRTAGERDGALRQALAAFGYALPDDGAAWLAERQAEWQRWQQAQEQRQRLERELAEQAHGLDVAAQQHRQWQDSWLALGQAERPALALQGEPQLALPQVVAQREDAQRRQQQKGGIRDSLESRRQDQQVYLQQAEQQWSAALAASPFADQAAFLAAVLDEPQRQQLAELQARLSKALSDAQVLHAAAAQQLAGLQVSPATELSTEQLDEQLLSLDARLNTLTGRQGEIRAQLQGDDARRQNLQSLFAEIAAKQVAYDLWQQLNSLIGSADGAKYRKFAQGLTLDHLVYLANQQLERLHGRYQLARRGSGELELEVIDTWQADVARDTKTLSGGESFLVSLALALALSDLVSHKTSIDSLFLDEGFGTLDGETLEIALDALDSLNASGKMIGVISHVEAMKERIPVQLKVHKGVGMGYSGLDRRFAVIGKGD